MPGYDPRCPNYHRCWTCRGDGTVTQVTYERSTDGRDRPATRRITCSACGGRGGKVGVGPHQHG